MTQTNRTKEIIYPESDGKRMAENTLQFRWIVIIVIGLETLFRNNPAVFIAGDLLWYPVEGNNKLATAPDGMVIFGRPKGRRGAYLQWREGNIPPQVVFEVLSPGNRTREMQDKFNFYQRYGVQEYYVYNPDRETLAGWIRQNDQLVAIPADQISRWTSPLLQVRFQMEQTLTLFQPDGVPFATYDEILEQPDRARQAHLRAIHAEEQADEERRQSLLSKELARIAQEEAAQERRKNQLAQQQVVEERRRTQVAQQESQLAQQDAEEQRQRTQLAQQEVETQRQQAEEQRQQTQLLQSENERLKARLREAGLLDE